MTDGSDLGIPGVCEVRVHRGAACAADGLADLLLEVPHGATRARDFDALAALLRGPFPERLRDFFFVNTDVGAPEVAEALARRLVSTDPSRCVRVIRCLVPRTFVDCNRVIDARASSRTSDAGGVTPGIVEYVRDPDDLSLLLNRYEAYRDCVSRAYEEVCSGGGLAWMIHSYAPREVDVPVDEKIVERLHDAYAADRVETWPLRAEVDLITRTPDGDRLADDTFVDAVLAACREGGLDAREGATYPLHPSTLGHRFAARYPGQTLCVEVRRDLLVQTFTPFQEMEPDRDRVARLADCLAAGYERGEAQLRARCARRGDGPSDRDLHHA